MPSDPSEVDKKPYHGIAPPSSVAASANQQILQDYIDRLNAIQSANAHPQTAVQQIAQAYQTALGAASGTWKRPTKEVSEEDEFTKFVQEARMARSKAIIGWGMFVVWCFVLLAALCGALAFDWALWLIDLPVPLRIGIVSALTCVELIVVAIILNANKDGLVEWLNSK